MKKVSRLILTVMALTALIASSCTVSKEKKAANAMAEIMERSKAVGLAVAVVKDGEIIYSNSFGFKNLEEGVALGEGDIFRIASISKSFTTTALMTLVEQGALGLDNDVSSLVGFSVRNPLFPQDTITLRMLLSHTSSINDTQGYFKLDVLNPLTNPEYAKCYNNYAPGSKYEYCNLGFNTVGAIVERFSGVRFDNYIRKTITEPMGLTANFNPDSLNRESFVTLYSFEPEDTTKESKYITVAQPAAYVSRSSQIDSGYVMGYSTPLFSPTGGMKISAHNLARYMQMHMNYGSDPVTGVTIISKESAKAMQEPVADMGEGNSYCLAFRKAVNLIPGEVMTGHTGSAYGLYSAMFFEPEKRFGFVMITNGYKPEYKDGFTVIQGDVIRELYNIFIK